MILPAAIPTTGMHARAPLLSLFLLLPRRRLAGRRRRESLAPRRGRFLEPGFRGGRWSFAATPGRRRARVRHSGPARRGTGPGLMAPGPPGGPGPARSRPRPRPGPVPRRFPRRPEGCRDPARRLSRAFPPGSGAAGPFLRGRVFVSSAPPATGRQMMPADRRSAPDPAPAGTSRPRPAAGAACPGPQATGAADPPQPARAGRAYGRPARTGRTNPGRRTWRLRAGSTTTW